MQSLVQQLITYQVNIHYDFSYKDILLEMTCKEIKKKKTKQKIFKYIEDRKNINKVLPSRTSARVL